MGPMPERFPNLHVVDHPLVQHKLTGMRRKESSRAEFRRLLREIGMLMTYEATRNWPLGSITIQTPVAEMQAPCLVQEEVAIIPVLRAGLGMAEGVMEILPTARMGHIGVYRDPKTKAPVEYLVKLPPARGQHFLLVDPMLATGGSAAHAVDIVLGHGAEPKSIVFMALVAAPEGLAVFFERHPNIPVFVASLDLHLDERAYIVPGLGDAGDRIYGT
ncbi:MAG: uracil phosphoribosyltransferase [Spirochaetales bacterium]|nr:uracil phosphoribosyltransferase [Spirochaetales bacterium]MCP5486551.1 uracil phosphoribosyltransferase [Spirochaetales bacterium]